MLRTQQFDEAEQKINELEFGNETLQNKYNDHVAKQKQMEAQFEAVYVATKKEASIPGTI